MPKRVIFMTSCNPLSLVQIGGGKASVRSVDDVADVTASHIAAGDS